MANDDLLRDPAQQMADFIQHTRDACWDLQFYSEWCLNHGREPGPVNVEGPRSRSRIAAAVVR